MSVSIVPRIGRQYTYHFGNLPRGSPYVRTDMKAAVSFPDIHVERAAPCELLHFETGVL
jgi:hypothetical protein